jgi:anti-anti-sigma factor
MKISEKNGVRLITLETEHLDALNSEEMRKLMIDGVSDAEKVVLNLGEITFIDSSGLGVILTLFRHIKENKGNMAICSVKESVKVLFKLVRLSHMIQIFETETEALTQV